QRANMPVALESLSGCEKVVVMIARPPAPGNQPARRRPRGGTSKGAFLMESESQRQDAPPADLPALTEPGSPGRRRRLWLGLLLVGVLLLPAGWFGGRYLWAASHLRRAEQELARYDFPEALEDLERYLRVYPNSVPTRLLAARTARRADLLDRAAEHLD